MMYKSHVVQRSTGRAARAVAAASLALVMVVAGCSSDTGTASAPTTTAPEQKISSDADVAAGLAKMQASATAVGTAGPDTARAAKADDELEPAWKTIEGTVKKNEPALYTDIEDALSLLSAGADGDEAKSTAGAEAMTTAITAYLTKHPG